MTRNSPISADHGSRQSGRAVAAPIVQIYAGPGAGRPIGGVRVVPGGGTRLVGAAAVRQHQRSGPGAADLLAVAVGGGVGSVARYLLAAAFPAGHGFPWAIFAVNVSGCWFLGLLMVYLLEVWPPRRFLRPFLAIGLIGGYTTFSTYAGGVLTLLTGNADALAATYALSSIAAGLVAVWLGMKTGRIASGLPACIRARFAGGGQ